MYEIYFKSWYQEMPDKESEEIIDKFETIDDAFNFLKQNGEYYIEYYPVIEIGIRLK